MHFGNKLNVTNDNNNDYISKTQKAVFTNNQHSRYIYDNNNLNANNVNNSHDNNDNNKTNNNDSNSQQSPSSHLKLTAANLEQHNKFNPPKSRDVKDIIWQQIEFIRVNNMQYLTNNVQQ